jgi:hypothetical protein
VLAEFDLPVSCTHRWKIASPVGEACSGTCLLCGAMRSFTNERFPFGQPSKVRKAAAPLRPAPVPPSQLGSLSSFLQQRQAKLNEA